MVIRSLIISLLLLTSVKAKSEFLYPINPENLISSVESSQMTINKKIHVIEDYFDHLYHLVNLNYKPKLILHFFDKYETLVLKYGNPKNIGQFYLNKGTYYIDNYQSDSASTYFFKALDMFEEVKDYSGIAHANLFIAVNNSLHIGIRKGKQNFVDFYYQKGYEASLQSDDLFVKASGNWNKGVKSLNKSMNSALNYFNLAIDNLNQLNDDRLHHKLFGYTILNYLFENYRIDKSLEKKLHELIIVTFQRVIEKKYFDTHNFKCDFVTYYKLKNMMDSAAYFANLSLKDTVESEIWGNQSNYRIFYHYLTIYEYEKSIGNYKSALSYYEKYHEMWDNFIQSDPRVISLVNDRIILEKKYLNKQLEQSKRQSFIIIIASIVILTILFTSIYYYKRFKERQKISEVLAELNKTKDSLFAIISHDLRSPVASLKQMLDVINIRYDKLDDESKHKYLQSLGVSSNKLYLLLDNLLSWSKINLGQITCDLSEVDISSLIIGEIELLSDTLHNKGIGVITNFKSNRIQLLDENIVRIIFRNLLTNAIKYSPKNENITIELYNDDSYLFLSIEDKGKGIPKEVIEKVANKSSFKPGFGTANESGNGLGLSIVSQLAEIHNAKLIFETIPNNMTKVVLKFQISN